LHHLLQRGAVQVSIHHDQLEGVLGPWSLTWRVVFLIFWWNFSIKRFFFSFFFWIFGVLGFFGDARTQET
jgi:hypothetical protein